MADGTLGRTTGNLVLPAIEVQNGTLSANLSGTGTLTKTTSGSVALTGSNSGFTGNVYMNAGTITGFGNAVENTVAIGADSHVVLQDVIRNGLSDFFTMRIA